MVKTIDGACPRLLNIPCRAARTTWSMPGGARSHLAYPLARRRRSCMDRPSHVRGRLRDAAMERRTIEVHVAGQKVRVVSSAGEAELHRLAEIVSAKLREVTATGAPQPPQALLLAAMALAHEAETERSRRESVEVRTRDVLRRMLVRIDEALSLGEDPHDTEAD